MLSRRDFVKAGPLAAALAPLGRARRLQDIGVQLYTVRSMLADKTAETLRAIRQIGYKEIECFGDLNPIWPAISSCGMKPVSLHLESTVVTKGSADNINRMVDQTKQRGFAYAVFPYLPPAERGGLDVIKALAAKLNTVGEKFRAAGIRFCYHNHAFEFQPMNGTTPFQVLKDSTDQNLVGFEADVFWVSVAGNDPVQFVKNLSGRMPLIHLKDKAKGTPVQYNEQVDRSAFKEVGRGVIDWPKLLTAADSAGVEHWFVEQDQTPGSPIESLRLSYTYLNNLDF